MLALDFINIGNGDCILIREMEETQQKFALMVDFGHDCLIRDDHPGELDPRSQRIYAGDFLRELGVTHLDVALATHFHRDHTNIGAIFRSAAALGMDAVLLTAAGSDPLYRRASRVSMGNVFLVPWTYLPEGVDWTETLRQHGFKTAAMALREDSIRLNDPHLAREPKLAVVMGTEGDGLASDTIAHCDYTVMIPMTHGVDSLNVAAASAVAFYQLGLMSCPE